MRKKVSRKETRGLSPGEDLPVAAIDFLPPGGHRVIEGRSEGGGGTFGMLLRMFLASGSDF